MQPDPDSARAEPAAANTPTAPKLTRFMLLSDRGRLWFKRFWRVCWLLIAILGVLWAGLSWYVVNYIDSWRPRLELELARVWQRPVQITQLQAEYDGLIPAFTLKGLRIPALDNESAAPLSIARIDAHSNLFLLSQGQLSRLFVQGLDLQVTRLSAQVWQFGGYNVDMAAPSTMDLKPVWDSLFSQRRIRLDQATVRWEDRYAAPKQPTPLRLGPIAASMENKGQAHHFTLQGAWPQELGADFALQANFESPHGAEHIGQFENWQGQMTLSNTRLELKAASDLIRTLTPLPVQVQAGSLREVAATINLAPPPQASSSPPATTMAQWLARLQWQGKLRVEDLSAASSNGQYRLETQPRGLQLQLQFKDYEGQAQVQLRNSTLVLGDLLVAKRLPVQQLNTQLRYQLRLVDALQIGLQVDSLNLRTADLALSANGQWSNHDSRLANLKPAAASLGWLDLNGALERARLDTLVQYLPQASGPELLRYLQAALGPGEISQGKIRILGPVANIPAFEPQQGQFTLSAQLQRSQLRYLPDYLAHQGKTTGKAAKPWPALEQLSGQFQLDGKKLSLGSATAQLANYPKLAIKGLSAQFADVRNLQLKLGFEVEGQADEAMRLLQQSALAELINNAAAKLEASGPLALKMAMDIPISTPQHSRLNGVVTLKGNVLRINADMPPLQQLVGTININEKGFDIPQARAVVMGGPITIRGGMPAALGLKDPATLALHIQALVRAAQIRSQTSLGVGAHAAQLMEGETLVDVNFRLQDGRNHIEVKSSLQGMALKLPEPFKKDPQTSLPLAFRMRPSPEPDATSGDTIELTLDHPSDAARKLLTLRYDLSGSAPTQALRGQIGVNLPADESPPELPDRVSASINLDTLVVDEWLQVIQILQRGGQAKEPDKVATSEPEKDTPKVMVNATTASAEPPAALAQSPTPDPAASEDPAPLTKIDTSDSFLPRVMVLRAKELQLNDRVLHQVTLAGSREGRTWTVNGLADEFSGFAQYHQGDTETPAKVFARLDRLHLGKNEVRRVDALLDKVETEPTTTLPDIDVSIADLVVDQIKLGRVLLQAENTLEQPEVNRNLETASAATTDSASGFAPDAASTSAPTPANDSDAPAVIALQDRTWKLHKLLVTMPHAEASVQGSWQWRADDVAQGKQDKRLRMQFDVNTDNLGAVLNDLNLPDTVQGGSGNINGHVTWLGAPFSINYPQLGGQVSADVSNGQILKVDPGALKLLGIFSLQFLPRLFSFNLNSELQLGFTFDSIKGDVTIDQGVAHTENLAIKNGSLANVDITGGIDLVQNQYDLLAYVSPQVNFGSAALAASAVLGPTMLALLPAQWLLSKALSRGTEQYWQVRGPLSAPEVTQLAGPNGPPLTPKDNPKQATAPTPASPSSTPSTPQAPSNTSAPISTPSTPAADETSPSPVAVEVAPIPHATPDIAPVITPGTAPATTPETAPVATPETALQAPPETAVETTPASTPEPPATP